MTNKPVCPFCGTPSAADVERLVEAARMFEEVGWTQRGWEDCLQKLKAALKPFKEE